MLDPAQEEAAPIRGPFAAVVQTRGAGRLTRANLDTVQVNIGLTCNLACHHCHVVSSPKRTEQMSWETAEQVLDLARHAGAKTLDITGGAPEMNPHFRRLVEEARAAGLHVMVRTNLTILLEPGYQDLPTFFRDHRVHLVASLPCYLPENVDRQRGPEVHAQSMEAMRLLCAEGYGTRDDLPLDLVFNPGGPKLPPAQEGLEQAYRKVLREDYGLEFTRLIAITNMAIGRFLGDLQRADQAESYKQLLREAYNPATIDGLMCRHQIHVSYDGTLHDCDFNYALRMPLRESGTRTPRHVRDVTPDDLLGADIVTAEHCFGCTAGAGSSCGGALA